MSHWKFPLKGWTGQIPQDTHPGSFGAVRKFDVHTGVDLYCKEGTSFFAVENGVVVEIEVFTGPKAESPWWHETHAVLIGGPTGVICYGEVETSLKVGDKVLAGDELGTVKQVLKKDKGKPRCMLHFELYEQGAVETVWWKTDEDAADRREDRPEGLLDPTAHLLNAWWKAWPAV